MRYWLARRRNKAPGRYLGEWYGPKGWVRREVVAVTPCNVPHHAAVYPYCVRLGPCCYPPRDIRLIERLGDINERG